MPSTARRQRIEEEDLYTIIYTSGTTGPPKGCMLRHRNYYAMVSVVDSMEDHYRDDDLMLLYLPLAHNFGRLMLLTGAYVGFPIAFLPNPLRVGEAMLEVRPTVLPSVPRVYEKVYSAVQARFDEATGVKRRLIDWALPIGREVSRLEGEGKPSRAGSRDATSSPTGSCSRRCATAWAGACASRSPAARRSRRRSRSSSTRSASASSRVTGSPSARPRPRPTARARTASARSAGAPRLRGQDRRGRRDPGSQRDRVPRLLQGPGGDRGGLSARTAGCSTGDVAELDADGYITITDRKKDILVTAGGKNVAPQNLENDLKTSKYVSQALVVGDRQPYVAALITLDEPEIGRWAAAQGIAGDVAVLARDERVRALLQEVVDETNRERSRYEQVKRFAILPRDFTMEHGEVTPTLKLRRRAVMRALRGRARAAVRAVGVYRFERKTRSQSRETKSKRSAQTLSVVGPPDVRPQTTTSRSPSRA